MKIAIDGPSGSGKSTLAKAIAKELNIYYLDTGSMYRSVAYAAIQKGINISDESQVSAFMDSAKFATEYTDGVQQNFFEDKNVMPYLRTPQISKASSDISAYACVRTKLLALQRDVANSYDIVLDGRDIGTVVLPNADYKFFVTASLTSRAKRRHLENSKKGMTQSLAEVTDEMKRRDYNDSHRKIAPLKQASDAILIDTTNMSINEAVSSIINYLK